MRQLFDLDAGYSARLLTPFCVLGVRTSFDQLTQLEYLPLEAATLAPVEPLTREVDRQLRAFLRDPAHHFDLPCKLEGSDFQRSVWALIRSIPNGETMAYGQIARMLGTSARAVGACCGANRFPLIIPCHRVVGAGGIGGFMHTKAEGGALTIKRWLLRHEGAIQ